MVSGLDAGTVPVVYFTANWEMKYDAIDFYVGNDLYCTSLVDRKERELKCPLKTPDDVIGWDRVDGDWLPGIQRPMKIVCSSTKGPDEVIDEHDHPNSNDYQLVCQDGELLKYKFHVNARVSSGEAAKFKVTYWYLDDEGLKTPKFVENVEANTVLPKFHVHQTIELADEGIKKVFRYWRLASGNLTSSMTVLSDLTLVAVYDEVELNSEDGCTEVEPEVQKPEAFDDCRDDAMPM